MIRADSIKIKAPIDSVIDCNLEYFSNKIEKASNSIITDTYEAKQIDFGINRISIEHKRDSVIIEASAKALKQDYSNGINKDNFGQFIDSINNTNRVKLDTDLVYNNGELLRVDVTDNVKLNYNGDVLNDLSLLPLPNKYEITPYQRKENRGLVLKGKQSSFKERMILYDKTIELKSTRYGRQFLDSFDSAQMLEEFEGTLRVENNFTQLRKIREYLGSTNVKEALTSNNKPNLMVFNKITRSADTEVLYLFDRYEGMSIKKSIELRGIEGIIKDAKYNWSYLELWLKTKSPSNYRRERKKFKQIYNEMLNEKQKDSDISIVKMFSEALSKVA